MVDGFPFAPFKIFNGAVAPDSLFAIKCLTSDAKVVYTRLLSYCRDKDSCNPRLETIADAVGLSEDRTERALKQLKEQHFIKRIRSGPGRAAVTQLLWNSLLSPSLKLGLDPAPVRNQVESLIPQNQGSDSAPVRCLDSAQVRIVYKEEEVQFEEVQEVSTTTKAPFPISNEKHPKAWWSEEQVTEARRLLEFHSTNRQLGKPDSAIAGRILVNLQDWADFELYLSHRRQSPGPYAKSWAFYEKDVKDYWPQRRKDCLSDQALANRKELERAARMEQEDAERQQRIANEAKQEKAKFVAERRAKHPETCGMSEEELDQWMVEEIRRLDADIKAKSIAESDKQKAQSEKDLCRKTEQFERVQASIIESQQRKKQTKQDFLPNPTGLQHTSVLLSQMGAA